MTIKLPKTWMGKDGKEEYERIVNSKDIEKPIKQVSFNENIIKSDYIQIPNQNFAIAIAETDFNLNYVEANKSVLNRGLFVPCADEFMIFHNHILDCYKNKKPIFDAAGNPAPESTKKDLYSQLTSKCWIWLNGQFHLSGNKRTIEKIIGLDANNNLLTKEEPLEECLMEDCYIDFRGLNRQGLALNNSRYLGQKYVKGGNIFFYYPRNNSVAGFGADSGRAGLYCSGDPSYGSSGLGVRAVRRE